MTLIFESDRPVADGISYDDCYEHNLTLAQVNFLASRGLVFMTELAAGGMVYAGTIIASDQRTAEFIAFGRGLEETVIAQLACLIDSSDEEQLAEMKKKYPPINFPPENG